MQGNNTTMALSRQTLNFYRLYNEKIARRFKAKHVDELSQVEYLLMAIVVSEGCTPIRSLCERTCMLKQQVTKNLNHLQEMGYITREQLREAAVRYGKSDYGRYLLQIADTVED